MHFTVLPAGVEPGTTLDWAQGYHERGWSVIPIRPGTKRPLCRSWVQYQCRRPSLRTLLHWFDGRDDPGMAVVLGVVSGGLVCRDFDEMAVYQRWAADHADLAKTLPTVTTARGKHVYFRAAEEHLVFRDLGDGEYRGDSGHYCILPPSRHPDGAEYRWEVPLPNDGVPFIDDPVAVGLLVLNRANVTESTERTDEYRENRREQKTTEAIGAGPQKRTEKAADIDDHSIAAAFLACLPKAVGRRNRQVFELARALKAIPRFADAEARDLEHAVRRWHTLGLERAVIGTDPFEETWIDFLRAWPKVRFPKGAEPMTAIFQQAQLSPLPDVAAKYEQPKLKLLVSLCAELQRVSKDAPFFLSCRTAGRLLDENHVKASRWLFLLVQDGVLALVEQGNQKTRRASRYRYQAGQ